MPAFFTWQLTMLTSFWAWLGFYETRTGVLALKMKTLFTPAAYGRLAWHEAAACYITPDGLVLCCFLALTGAILLLEWLSIRRHDAPYCLLQRPWVAVILILLTVSWHPKKTMDSSTSHSNPRFPAYAARLLLTAIVAWMVCIFYTVHLNPELKFYAQAAGIKNLWAEKMSREHGPKVLIYGGSSCAFSINGEQMLNQFNLPTVNDGNAAGIGARRPE